MRIVNFNYLNQAYLLLKDSGLMLSNKRLRRCAYLDVHQSNYKSYELYNSYRKVVNSDAAVNQKLAILLVIIIFILMFLVIS